MSHDSGCVFCKIVAGGIPASVVYKTDTVLAFLDVGPLADGHLLVIPREHYGALDALPVALCAQLAGAFPVLGKALLAVTKAEGFNLLCNQGEAAGQVVPHVHFHLIPRRRGDGLGYRWNAGNYAAGRAEELAATYRQVLSQEV